MEGWDEEQEERIEREIRRRTMGFRKEKEFINDPLHIQWDEEAEGLISEIMPGVHLHVTMDTYRRIMREGQLLTDDTRVIAWLSLYLLGEHYQ